MRGEEGRWLVWACALCVCVFWPSVGCVAPLPLANPGCEYTNMDNRGKRGGDSDEYSVNFEVLLETGAVVSWNLKICLFRNATPCFPELLPKRLELKPLEDHLSSQAPSKYPFQLDKKLKHPGFLSGKEKPEFEKRYYDLVFKLRSLNCLSEVCQEKFKGSTITGKLAICMGPPRDPTRELLWSDFQKELDTYAKDLEAAAKRVNALLDACNTGKREKKYFELGRALVQMHGPTSPIHTIEICLFHPGAPCFPDKHETKGFLKFIKDKVESTGANISALTSGAGKVYDLRSWSCWTGSCETTTKQCALGQRVSKVLQFTELTDRSYRIKPDLSALVILIIVLLQTLCLPFSILRYS